MIQPKKLNAIFLLSLSRKPLNRWLNINRPLHRGTDVRENNTLSEPLVIRVYQLKERKTFDKTVYQQLLNEEEMTDRTDLLATRDRVVKPGGDMSLSMLLEDDAHYVAVVGLFRHPDTQKNSWKLAIDREVPDSDKTRVIEARDNPLLLLPLKDK